MMAHWAAWLTSPALAIWLYLWLFHGGFWRADRRLAPVGAGAARARVVAVVPARDEEEGVGAALASLLAQDVEGLIIILVDDHSRDSTRAIADAMAENSGGRLIVTGTRALPMGWTGKLWAVAEGVRLAREVAPDLEFLLFTDADVEHGPGTLKALLAKAGNENRDLVSLMVELDHRGFWGRLLIPAFVFFFQKLYPFARVADPDSPVAGAAGGCALVRRSVFERAGGVEAYRDRIIDDCALASAIKGAGGRLWLGLGETSRSLRDNRSLASVWNMVARTAYTQLHHSPFLLVGTLAGLGVTYLAPPLAVLGWPLHGQGAVALAGLGAWGLMVRCYRPTLRLYGQPVAAGVLLPLVALLYGCMTLASAARHWRGRGGQWKGRVYPAADPAGVGAGAMSAGDAVTLAIETPSGKTAGDENFPVGSWLLPARLRGDIAAFYAFARAGDDIADNGALSPEERVRRLDAFALALDQGVGDPASLAKPLILRARLAARGVPARHGLDLLAAFRQDCLKTRTADWGDLMAYCALSAAPVGRFLMDLHGETRAPWPAVDALCAALQVLNHLQDAKEDLIQLDRCYLPQDWLEEAGAGVEDLRAGVASPGLRRVIDRCLDGVAGLLAEARRGPGRLASRRLAMETAVIVKLAERLARRLRQHDPVAGRVKLGKADFLACGVSGALWGWFAAGSDHSGESAAARHAEAVVARSGSSFQLGMRILPPARRQAQYAIYAFCREVDDIADGDDTDAVKRQRLADWRREIDRVYAGDPTTPTARALVEPAQRFHMERAEFLAVIDGMEMDLGSGVFAPDMATLTLYCRRVAGAVGLLSLNAFGALEPQARDFALALGEALQLTNILRDIDEDAAIGRLYLPGDLLARHGIDAGAGVLAVTTHINIDTACRELAAVARQRFEDADRLLTGCERANLLPALLMMGIYEAILARLERRGWAAPRAPLGLGKAGKLWAALRRGWLRPVWARRPVRGIS